ncbi:hypothetical protein EXIGLDRAFT_730145 [Exidia glandulosa HHB12029]|uniref:Methyltransferase-domain-containing protein n=1 Tax=Exidia glandulosa HHB12029 TaxID=1314781 RepID=A0A165ZF66_EXIGL|nr:hypothetical protein EXIGLDRAFT_730145 [Exidia glandulosa HHB12029]
MSRPAIIGPDIELIPVVDPEEEVFLLYTALQSTSTPLDTGSALGSVNSHDAHVTIEFDLPASKGKRRKTGRASEVETVSIELAQDITSLRTRKGDTGSVLWRASVFLARIVLTQHRTLTSDKPTLFDRDAFSQSTVLELGAGTGLLAVALGRLVANYIATDLDFLVHLMRKNLALNDIAGPPSANVRAEAVDWELLKSLSPSKRASTFPCPDNLTVVLAVDTLYNPSLISAFVAALEHYSGTGACTLVVCELRAEDVVRDFLEAWLAGGKWDVHRVGSDIFELPFVCWIGRYNVENNQ